MRTSRFATLLLAIGLGPLFLLSANSAFAQSEDSAPPSTFISEIDQKMTIQKVSVLPFTDNVEGIYARALESHFVKMIQVDHQWDLIESNSSGNILTPNELESSPADVKKLGANAKADALIAVRITKSSTGVNFEMDLFLVVDGKLFVQETVKDHPHFDINELKQQLKVSYNNLKNKIPYRGYIMSRKGTRVTVSYGKKDGAQPDQVINAIQIINVTRHPKLHFLVSTEKEVLGKIKLVKVDDTLSFGVILSEKGKGTLQRNTKLASLDFVSYGNEGAGLAAPQEEGVENRTDSNVSFGKNPTEWTPVEAAKYGAVFFKLGVGSYTYNTNLSSTGALSATSSFSPSMLLGGELWITPNWTVEAWLKQGIISAPNPRTGSTPSDLNIATSQYSFAIAYNFLLQDDFWGPKIQALLGFNSFKTTVDSSSPLALTSTSYSGYSIGVRGSLPITPDRKYEAGAELLVFISSNLNETPQSSGATASSTINNYSLFGSMRMNHRMMVLGSLDFQVYSTTFTGSGTRSESATNSSQRSTTLTGGVKYLF